MSFKKTVFILGLLFLSGRSGQAQDDEVLPKQEFIEGAKQEKLLRIGLVDCLTYALKNNPDIQIVRLDPLMRQDELKVEEAGFSPSLAAGYTVSDSRSEPASVAYPGRYHSRSNISTATLSGRTGAGLKYSADLTGTQIKSNLSGLRENPYYTVQPQLTVTQPIFRGAGALVNQANISIARNNILMSDMAVEKTAMEVLYQAEAAYYNYCYFTSKAEISRTMLEWTKQLTEIVKLRYSKGLASSADVLEVEAAQAQQQKEDLAAEAALKKGADALKQVTNLVEDPKLWDARIELIDSPQFTERAADLAVSLAQAFKRRPDYLAKKKDLANRDIRLAVSKNSTYPSVDLTASFGLNGLGGDWLDAVKNMDSGLRNWSAGVKFSIPLGKGDAAAYDRKQLEKAQGLLELAQLEQMITLEVRDKVRQVQIQARQVQAAKLSFETEAANFTAQEAKYAAGQISTHDLLEYRMRADNARLEYERAVIDYNLALVDLQKSQGTLLEDNNVRVQAPPAAEQAASGVN